uniref:Fork-head domain-containing protein n=1 Tax=Strongyloides papillosus TaxID=174720 RepID=A0A0N5B6L2_STREA
MMDVETQSTSSPPSPIPTVPQSSILDSIKCDEPISPETEMAAALDASESLSTSSSASTLSHSSTASSSSPNLALLATAITTAAKNDFEENEKEERPSLSYKDLIIEAIETHPEKRLKLSEIYHVIRQLHPYYRKRADQWGWQNSIRHNLSLHDCFVKLPLKQTSSSGVVGHFWTVVRDVGDKNSSRRRARNNVNGAPNRNSGTPRNGRMNRIRNDLHNSGIATASSGTPLLDPKMYIGEAASLPASPASFINQKMDFIHKENTNMLQKTLPFNNLQSLINQSSLGLNLLDAAKLHQQSVSAPITPSVNSGSLATMNNISALALAASLSNNTNTNPLLELINQNNEQKNNNQNTLANYLTQQGLLNSLTQPSTNNLLTETLTSLILNSFGNNQSSQQTSSLQNSLLNLPNLMTSTNNNQNNTNTALTQSLLSLLQLGNTNAPNSNTNSSSNSSQASPPTPSNALSNLSLLDQLSQQLRNNSKDNTFSQVTS